MVRCGFQSSTLSPASLRRAVSLAALASALYAPVALAAQDDAPNGRTHLVKSGDTLWDIARVYLNDPFQWPEIYRVNEGLVEDPHWIYPGESLSIPGEEPVGVVEAVAPSNTTVFARARVERQPVARAVAVPQQASIPLRGVREGEVYAAPWVDRIGGPAGRGELLERVAESVIAEAASRKWLQLQDRAYIKLPAGSGVRRGDRFVIVRLGAEVGVDGQLVIPTGVVEVEDGENGDAPTVRVIRQFDAITLGQGIIALQRFPIPENTVPAQKVLGVRTQVTWVPSEAVLPSVQHYVILGASLRDGVGIGDEFTLLRPRVRLDNGAMLPEEPLALAQVVRVTDRGTTVLLVDQRHPSISIGTLARLTAKMP